MCVMFIVAQEDEKFLKTLFQQISDDELDDFKRKDLVLFLKELCLFSQTLQQEPKGLFFKVVTPIITIRFSSVARKYRANEHLCFSRSFSASARFGHFKSYRSSTCKCEIH